MISSGYTRAGEQSIPRTGVNDMFNKNKKSVRIVSGIIIILLVLAMLASVVVYLI